MVDYSSRDSPYRLISQQREEYSLDVAATLRSLRAKTRSWKVENDRLVEA